MKRFSQKIRDFRGVAKNVRDPKTRHREISELRSNHVMRFLVSPKLIIFAILANSYYFFQHAYADEHLKF